MTSTRFVAAIMLMGSAAQALAGTTPAAPVGPLVDRIASRLQQKQIVTGWTAGNWQAGFNGSIVAGMVRAYEYTGNPAYLAAARLGGDYIILDAQNGLFGDDAYALMELSQGDENPEANRWRTVLSNFYQHVREADGGTFEYIDWYRTIDPSTAVFYLAHHALAAHYVDAADKRLWRSTLVMYLSRVTDTSAQYPVTALGVATWALAQTGPLDGTPVGGDSATWKGKTLRDLPALLAGHQVPAGTQDAGTFYWRFDHQDDGLGSAAGGHTEDAVYAVLGLVAASRSNPEIHVDAAVAAARDALLNAADADGEVYETLAGAGLSHPAFAGELLQVLPELDALWAMGGWIVSGQVKEGERAGAWIGEEDFTGTLLTGVQSVAGRFPCHAQFQQALRLASQRVLSQTNLFGDEASALRCLSEAAADPSDNPFRAALARFYNVVENADGGTEGYLDQYTRAESSTAVFYLAHHVLGAYYVDAADTALWRAALLHMLSQVDDSAEYPVTALAIATWALAQTGPLDATPIGTGSTGPWRGKTLADLPSMLLSHQVPKGKVNAGSFYWRFDHAGAGFTEDTVFGLLGLQAAGAGAKNASSPALEGAIAAATTALTGGIGGSGKVYEHLSGDGASSYSYAAEVLAALCQ